MAKEVVSEELWKIVEPLLPGEPPKPKGSRPRIDDRAALTGILFVLRTGILWAIPPQEMGSGITCWRRLRERLHGAVLDYLGQADRIDWSRAILDSAAVPAPGGRKYRPPTEATRGLTIGLLARQED